MLWTRFHASALREIALHVAASPEMAAQSILHHECVGQNDKAQPQHDPAIHVLHGMLALAWFDHVDSSVEAMAVTT